MGTAGQLTRQRQTAAAPSARQVDLGAQRQPHRGHAGTPVDALVPHLDRGRHGLAADDGQAGEAPQATRSGGEQTGTDLDAAGELRQLVEQPGRGPRCGSDGELEEGLGGVGADDQPAGGDPPQPAAASGGQRCPAGRAGRHRSTSAPQRGDRRRRGVGGRGSCAWKAPGRDAGSTSAAWLPVRLHARACRHPRSSPPVVIWAARWRR